MGVCVCVCVALLQVVSSCVLTVLSSLCVDLVFSLIDLQARKKHIVLIIVLKFRFLF